MTEVRSNYLRTRRAAIGHPHCTGNSLCLRTPSASPISLNIRPSGSGKIESALALIGSGHSALPDIDESHGSIWNWFVELKQRYLAQSEVDFLGEEGDGAFEWCRGRG
jgi:hypothetical protein